MDKDYKRVQDIDAKDWNKATAATDKMVNATKDPLKLWARFIYAKRIGTPKMNSVAHRFLHGAKDLGYEKAVRLVNVINWRRNHSEELKRQAKREQLMPFVERLVRLIEKRTDAECRISSMCSHPYWSNDGLFISLDNLGDDTPYQGYSSGGPESINSYRRSYIGRKLGKICTIATNNGVNVYKDYSDFFIKIPFSKLNEM